VAKGVQRKPPVPWRLVSGDGDRECGASRAGRQTHMLIIVKVVISHRYAKHPYFWFCTCGMDY
jgi:hypothetical protein